MALTISYVLRPQQRSSKQRQAADGRGSGAERTTMKGRRLSNPDNPVVDDKRRRQRLVRLLPPECTFSICAVSMPDLSCQRLRTTTKTTTNDDDDDEDEVTQCPPRRITEPSATRRRRRRHVESKRRKERREERRVETTTTTTTTTKMVLWQVGSDPLCQACLEPGREVEEPG